MATIKAIDARSVHQIQSGQVIVDLCSVVKELVENSLDAGATSLDIRFRNNGLDSIEVQDNGGGLSPENYDSIALKHYTSKLSSYDDLSSLQTFGFRGEALSSLCALSDFHIVTAQADEAPKGNRLDFEITGKLKGTQVVASQKGTTAVVENLFRNLPVRRRELEKNIKREYGKVLGLLHAYACISTGVRFCVKNLMAKGKNVTVFATKSNPTTKENIANVYGAKTLTVLVPLALELQFESSKSNQKLTGSHDEESSKILIEGHISRPVFGEGRQTPDRQMFFVNSRPCGLPQIAKAFNEVYKSYNVSQSPFIFADFRMNTNAYDVNVSPDKRTILLHDSSTLIESLKTSLVDLFDKQDQTIPQSQLFNPKLPAYKQLTIDREASTDSAAMPDSGLASTFSDDEEAESETERADGESNETGNSSNGKGAKKKFLINDFLEGRAQQRENPRKQSLQSGDPSKDKQKMARSLGEANKMVHILDEYDDPHALREADAITEGRKPPSIPVRDFNKRTAARMESSAVQRQSSPYIPNEREESAPVLRGTFEENPNVIQNAFDRMRPKRVPAEVATITIGDKTTTSVIGTQPAKKVKLDADVSISKSPRPKRGIFSNSQNRKFGQSLRSFAAPGTQTQEDSNEDGADQGDEDSVTSSLPGDDDESMSETGEGSAGASQEDVQANSGDENGDQNAAVNDSVRQESDNEGSDEDYFDEAEKKALEKARVEQLIKEAEEKVACPTEDNTKRANKILKGGYHKDSTTSLISSVDGSIARIEAQLEVLQKTMRSYAKQNFEQTADDAMIDQDSAEERLSLTVSKNDFSTMRIIGQFNLGFILATRLGSEAPNDNALGSKDELFIIDQHASDEKYNFERLQAGTVVQNQRLVKPKPLDLTAVEEEIVFENICALEKNGFVIEIDNGGDQPIGRRCKLISLPLSKEVVFDTRDLEELLSLLAESPTLGPDSPVPRPSKVRRMFAMRACRSSVMVGKTLTTRQMGKLVRHMGEIDNPWNCPHGRPTMRHLVGLDAWDGWNEGDGLAGGEERQDTGGKAVWEKYRAQRGLKLN